MSLIRSRIEIASRGFEVSQLETESQKPDPQTRPVLHRQAASGRRTSTILFVSLSSTFLWPRIIHAATVNGESTIQSLKNLRRVSTNFGDSAHRLGCMCSPTSLVFRHFCFWLNCIYRRGLTLIEVKVWKF
ncbi:hypothetical protein RchiOBHm_Chr4g0389381 [Rosa chinensis]|uniref:Uncharacterized protein n=1 Tax=Rosa chinensis TaxID=74649 RepID=A0A2P6QPZ5_ROSCH|nr:hypothetical protein RchiOBHm_Chr4g0389381 [Rosa chinensis]